MCIVFVPLRRKCIMELGAAMLLKSLAKCFYF